jgi:hypothetical protein
MVPAEHLGTSVVGFRRLMNLNIGHFNLLDWTNILRDTINELFPINVGKYGRLDHPVTYLKSTALVEQWRLLSGIDQRNKIKSLEQEAERISNIQMRAASRERWVLDTW